MIFLGPKQLDPSRGTVILVALCFVAVLGIMLAGYLTLCSRVMTLSNRSFQSDLSRQLAEAGIEEALRAFNKNNWSDWSSGSLSVDWTLDTTNKRATATISFPSDKFAQGVTASTKVRVDNYDANILGSSWSSAKTYRIGDLVGYNGIWYRSVRSSNTNQTPSTTNMTWWIINPMPWTWSSDTTYAQYQMVSYKGIWYRCIAVPPVSAGTTTYAPAVPLPGTTYWTPIPTMRAWAASTAYSVYDVVAYTDPTSGDVSLYRCTTAHTSSASFSADSSNWNSDVKTMSLSWSSGSVYTRGAIVYYGSGVWRWYYCKQPGTSSVAPSLDTTMWAPIWYDIASSPGPCAIAPASDTAIAGTKYYVGDYVYITSASNWYRCTTDHTFNTWAADSGNWTNTNASPYLQLFYFGSSSLSTTSNSIFFYSGTYWYRYMGGYSYLGQAGGMHAWTSGYKYNPGDAVYYSSTSRWYRCILAHTASGSLTPSNTTYWATTPLFSMNWSSDKNYSQYDLVRYKGVWYLCISAHTSSSSIIPTNTSYWIGADTTNASYIWNTSTAYAANSYCCYDGVWYKCIAATTANAGHTPNNTTYWTPSWKQSWQPNSTDSAGAPVVYAEATVTLDDKDTVDTDDDIYTRTQLRAPIAPAPLFPNAAAASDSITVTAGGTVDSYDSISGTYASQVGTATNYSATLAAGATSGTAISLSSTAVKGYIAAPSSSSSPYAPLFSSGGTLKGYTSPISPNLDLTRVNRSPYIPKFDPLPSGGLSTNWSTTPKGTALSWSSGTTVNLGTPGDTTPSRYYYNGNLTVGTGSLTVLRINGPVILYINGNLSIAASGSTGRIEVSSTGSAEIHVAGAFTATSGGEGILSYNTDPRSLIIICDTTGTATHYYSEGVNPLYGVVYIPNSTSTTGFYNNNTSTHIYGAISANKISYSGADMNLHYDTSLRYATFGGVDQPYTVTDWSELSASEQATMP